MARRVEILTVLACLLAQARAVDAAARNPLLAQYRRETLAYERDAREAEAAAANYAQRAKSMIYGGGSAAKVSALEGLRDLKAKVWANAAWRVEHMLTDPAAAKAGPAAAEARAPYMAAYKDYEAKQGQYDAAAQGYAARANGDADSARQLLSYANQYRLEGNEATAGMFAQQSTAMMRHAAQMKEMAVKYEDTARKIHGALPTIEAMAGQAAARAAWLADPAGGVAPEHALPYTIAPPVAL